MKHPFCIGGLGGSGTRIYINILQDIGYYIGDELNSALDNLWWTLLFKRRSALLDPSDRIEYLLRSFEARMSGNSVQDQERFELELMDLSRSDRIQHNNLWLKNVSRSFVSCDGLTDTDKTAWGWKEPNTHVFSEKILEQIPELVFLHIVRNPLYMAFSRNQNQLENWGPLYLDREIEIGPDDSLEYWCAVHLRMELISSKFPGRVHFLSHDMMCRSPAQSIEKLLKIVGANVESRHREELELLVSREKIATLSQQQLEYSFDPGQIEWAKSFMKRQFGLDS